jgi:hypothetical protein
MSLDATSRTNRFLPADILTAGYRVVGKISVTNHGAMSMLNDHTRSSVEVSDAHMARLYMPTKLVDHFDLVRMMKQQIHTVCLARREDLGPQAIVRGGFTNLVEYGVRVTTPMFEVEGIMELPGRFDFTSLMTDGTRDFLPMYKATLTGILIPNLRVESAGILVNRKVVDIVAQLSHRVKPENET